MDSFAVAALPGLPAALVGLKDSLTRVPGEGPATPVVLEYDIAPPFPSSSNKTLIMRMRRRRERWRYEEHYTAQEEDIIRGKVVCVEGGKASRDTVDITVCRQVALLQLIEREFLSEIAAECR